MKRNAHSFVGRACRALAVVGIAALVLACLSYVCGARVNRTNSLPKGLYWRVNKAPVRGDIVAFWPDGTEPFRIARERGYILPGVYNRSDGIGYGLMLKRLVAHSGDTVSITPDGVTVNGRLLSNTKPLTHDNVGDPLPVVRLSDYRLAEHEALFVSDHLPRSYDARYFGIQDMRQIVEVVVPVWIW
ncbi:MAG: conjugative transfer signal peptidase TraF [Planctomycetaceae bacterium]|nr:conjugative transfer signal peptidase TraF [Planctomycetaceae bacterium]